MPLNTGEDIALYSMLFQSLHCIGLQFKPLYNLIILFESHFFVSFIHPTLPNLLLDLGPQSSTMKQTGCCMILSSWCSAVILQDTVWNGVLVVDRLLSKPNTISTFWLKWTYWVSYDLITYIFYQINSFGIGNFSQKVFSCVSLQYLCFHVWVNFIDL